MAGIKKQLIVDFIDYSNEPFAEIDITTIRESVEEALLQDYDIRVTKVTIKEPEEHSDE